MAKIITTRKDAEEAFDVLLRSQETLGYIPPDIMETVRISVDKGYKGSKLHFYKLLSRNPEIFKQFYESQD